MTTPVRPQSEELRITPTPCYQKPASYIKITLIVVAVLLAVATIAAYFQGVGAISRALLAAGSLVSITSLFLFNFLHQRRQNHNLWNQITTGTEDGVRSALTRGAKVEAKNAGGFTPLQHTAKQGNENLCRILIENGARVDFKSLALAINHDSLNVAKYLFSNFPSKKGSFLSTFTTEERTLLDTFLTRSFSDEKQKFMLEVGCVLGYVAIVAVASGRSFGYNELGAFHDKYKKCFGEYLESNPTAASRTRDFLQGIVNAKKNAENWAEKISKDPSLPSKYEKILAIFS